MDKTYTCICGETFTVPNKFNSHKNHCKIHIEQKYGSYELYIQWCNRNKLNKQLELKTWIQEQHQCETCGKIMTEKYGSGRFCCRACANTRKHSDETIHRIKKSMQKYSKSISNAAKVQFSQRVAEYTKNPKICCICGKKLQYDQRYRKTCSDSCKHLLLRQNSLKAVQQAGGNLNKFGVRGTAKYGIYKGIHCDSSYELAFVIYCFDHNISFERNLKGFEYCYNNSTHLYFPDFIINNKYIEIKNYISDLTKAKIDQFPADETLLVYDKKALKECLSYCKTTYGPNYAYLYDRDKPSWLDRAKM